MRSVLQPGNIVDATWRARLSSHLGSLTLEPESFRAASVIDDPFRLAGLSTLTDLVRLIPEREAHARLYDAFVYTLDNIEKDRVWPALLVRWELGLLDELGFGLDLSRCAVTGEAVDLAFVSPRSGRAVGAGVGMAYRDRLLALPAFLISSEAGANLQDVRDGFALTGFFLDRHVFEPRAIKPPITRSFVINRLAARYDPVASGA